MNYISQSQRLLQRVRQQISSIEIQEELSQGNLSDLIDQLDSQEKKLVFWINIYNAYIQILIKENPGLYDKRNTFFRGKNIMLAKTHFSLDDIEHGILRKSTCKFSLGYLKNPWASNLEKKLRVDRIDPRIHFALNCGAESCPPVRFYEIEKIDQQLSLATQSYLETEVIIKDMNSVIIPAIFSWFRGDFGGKKGIRKFLNHYLDIESPNPKIKYKNYDWSINLDNYVI